MTNRCSARSGRVCRGGFKRSIDGTDHQVSVEHLPQYLTEHDFRYSTRKMLPTSASVARMSLPIIGVWDLPWMIPKTRGNTPSRAIDKVTRAAGSSVVWVSATVDDSTAMIMRQPSQRPQPARRNRRARSGAGWRAAALKLAAARLPPSVSPPLTSPAYRSPSLPLDLVVAAGGP